MQFVRVALSIAHSTNTVRSGHSLLFVTANMGLFSHKHRWSLLPSWKLWGSAVFQWKPSVLLLKVNIRKCMVEKRGRPLN